MSLTPMTSRIDAFLASVLSVSPEELERDLAATPPSLLKDDRVGSGRGLYVRQGYRPPAKYWRREGPTRSSEYWVYKPDRLLRMKIFRDPAKTLVVLYLANARWVQAGYNRSAEPKRPQTVAEASLAVMASISRSPETERRDVVRDRLDRVRIKLEKQGDDDETEWSPA